MHRLLDLLADRHPEALPDALQGRLETLDASDIIYLIEAIRFKADRRARELEAAASARENWAELGRLLLKLLQRHVPW